MGGESYSYINYDSNGYGVFKGEASVDGVIGGGFSNAKLKGDYLHDLSEYDGIVVNVAS